MSDPNTERDPLEVIAEEYMELLRKGERPSVEDYAAQHPELAEEIRELFPTIAVTERLKARQERSSGGRATLGPARLERLGDFRIIREVGRGGMGVVFEAEQESLGRRVAVKVLPRQVLLDEKHLMRFQREARVAATRGDGTNFLDGVTNALIRLEMELPPWDQTNFVSAVQTNLLTDSLGEAYFRGLTAGQYKFYVTADKHQGYNGRLWIRAGATAQQQIALTYSLVTVTWEVVPVTIQDRYELILNATFETDVPAPVITIDPPVVNLPQMFAGDVYLGEFSVFNHGLIRADHFRFMLPASDAWFDYELQTGVPDHLDPRQRIRLPYRLVCKKNMPGPAQARLAASGTVAAARQPKDGGGGGCHASPVSASFDYVCQNGLGFSGGASSGFYYNYGGSCGGGGAVLGGGGGGGGGSPAGSGIAGMPDCFPDGGCSGAGGSDSTGACDNNGGDCKECAGSWVSLLSREYQDEVEDLSIKIPGGRAAVVRQFYRNAWRWTDLDRRLQLSPDTNSPTSIKRRLTDYKSLNTSHTMFGYRENRILQVAAGWRWQNKDGDWELYDPSGVLLQTGKRNLLLTKFQYDVTGRLLAIADRNDRMIFNYAYSGTNISAIQDLTGRRAEYTYAGGRLTQARNAAQQVMTYAYDGSGHMIEKTDVNGLRRSIAYIAGYVASVLDASGNGKFFQYQYDKNSRQYYAQTRTSAGQVKEKRFDADGKMVESRNGGLLIDKVLRDNRTEITTKATGVIWTRDYDEWGNLIREIRPDGGVWLWEYDPVFHQPVRKVDALGAVTLMSYDANGNLATQIEAFGTPIARTNAWRYDVNNQLVRRIDGRGNSMDYAYDANGNLVREFDPANPAYQTTYAYDLRGNRLAVTNALGFATLYGYDVLDRLAAETNALGYVTLYTYTNNNLVQVETGRDGANRGRIVRYRYDEHGRRTQTVRVDDQSQEDVWETTSYDADGRVIAVANALGQATRYEYNAVGQRVKIARPFSATETSDTRFEYDDYGRLAREIDPRGIITQYEYDDLDRQRKITEAFGTPVQRSRERGYDLAGNLTSLTYSDGTNALTTLYGYDLLNRRTQIRGAREYPKDFEYDAGDNLTAEINGRGYRTAYSYDQYSRRTNTVEGIGHGEPGEHAGSFAYDLLGRVVTSFDGNWNHRHYHYDALGRQTEQSIPLASTNALPAGNWWTDNSVVLNRTWYNPWGQAVTTSNIVGGVTVTVYDAFGRRFTHTDAAGLTLTNEYDMGDQLLAIDYPVVSSAPAGSPPTSLRYAYSPNNSQMLVSTTDRANLTTRYGYDKRFQRARELSSWGALTTYRTDELGRQTAVTNALNEVTQSVFDQFDQLVATIYADHVPITQERIEYRAYDELGEMTNHWGAATYDVAYAYDLTGNQVSLTDGNGSTTRWEYNGRNRKVRKIYADNSDYAYGYDANGNQTRKRDAMQRTIRYEFSAYNLLVRTDYPNDPDVTFRYDPAGRRVLMVDGTGTNTWSYDSADRVLTNAQFSVQHSVSYTYDAEGNRLSMTVTPLAGGDVWHTDYAYASAGRLENITDHGVSEAPFRYSWATNAARLTALTYPSGLTTRHGYDMLGRKTLLLASDSANVAIALFAYGHNRAGQRTYETTLTHTDRFEYDAKRQLVSAERYDQLSNADSTWSYRYAYDVIGNWRTATGPDGVHSYTVNALNQYTSIANNTPRALHYDANGNLRADGVHVYDLDDVNRLVSVSNAVTRATFRYDGLGRCVGKRFSSAASLRTTDSVYDGQIPVAFSSSDARNDEWLTRGPDRAFSWQQMGGIGGILTVRRTDNSRHAISDVPGTVRVSLGSDAWDAEDYDYDPFGTSIGTARAPESAGFMSKEALDDFG